MPAITLFSPAKINLFLATVGKRTDGYHEIVSLVAPLSFGDSLSVATISNDSDHLACTDPTIPSGQENLVRVAAELFRKATGIRQYFSFHLDKHIPAGGGLGGGSGNAVCALEAMNQLTGGPLSMEDLPVIAAKIGSDCPLFLHREAAIIRGRGEFVEPLPGVLDQLRSWSLLLVNPGFGVSTRWAYEFLASSGDYTRPDEAEARWRKGLGDLAKGDATSLLRNDLGDAIARKFLFYPALFNRFRDWDGIGCGITGSGSCGFFLATGEDRRAALRKECEAVGLSPGFLIETSFFSPHDSI